MGSKRVPNWDVRPVDESVEDGGEWWVFQGHTRTYAAPMPALSQLSSVTMIDLYWVAIQVLQSIEAQTDPNSSIKVEAKTFTRWPVFRLPDPLPRIARLALDLLNHCLEAFDELDPDTWDRQADAKAGCLFGLLRSERLARVARKTVDVTGPNLKQRNEARINPVTRDEIIEKLRLAVQQIPGSRTKTARKTAAAKELGISVRTLTSRMKDFKIRDDEWCEKTSD